MDTDTLREVIRWIGIPLLDVLVLALLLGVGRVSRAPQRALTLPVGLAVAGTATVLSGLFLEHRARWQGGWIGVGTTLLVICVPASVALGARSRSEIPARAISRRVRAAIALFVLAALAAVAEIRWPSGVGRTAADHPITVQVVTSIAVLAATYLILDEVVERRGSLRWKPAAVQGLREIRSAVNYLDGLVIALCIAAARRSNVATPADLGEGRARDEFVRRWLQPMLEAEESYVLPPTSRDRSLMELDDAGTPDVGRVFTTWSTLLILNRDLQDLANSLPDTAAETAAVTALLRARVKDSSLRTGSENARSVALAFKRYEQARRRTLKLLDAA